MEEARAHRRYRVWLPVQISGDTLEAAVAVSRDASAGGMLMSATDAPEVGSRIRIRLIVPAIVGEAREHEVEGTIVRVEPNNDDPHGPFPWRIAARFDEELPELENLLGQMQRELEESK